MSVNERRNKLIKSYFYNGYTYETITQFLYAKHGMSLSVRQLKRVLRQLRLRRRSPLTRHKFERVKRVITKELQGSGNLLGYRQLWRRIVQKHRISVSRELVRRMLRLMAPINSNLRRKHRLSRRLYYAKGPNHVWHADGFDKLKPYGFAIHGCIDGFSRRIIWLKVGVTNNNPAVIANHFVKSVLRLKGVPRVLRCDLGTENSYLAWIQPFLRRNHRDSLSSPHACFRYGRSVSNQRIEAWWSILKKFNAAWWISLFQGLQDCGIFDESDPMQVDCLRLAFTAVLQKELDQTAREWNTHYIRKQRNPASPNGIPDKLYTLPELYGARNLQMTAPLNEVQYIHNNYTEPPPPPADIYFLRQAKRVMQVHNLHLPLNVFEAVKFYVDLYTILDNCNE